MSIFDNDEALTSREKRRGQGLEEERLKQKQLDKIVDDGSAFAGGYLLDIPGMFGFEDYTYGPGITDAIDIKKRRYRENGKLKIDREVLGPKKGLEQFVEYDPKGTYQGGSYQDLLTGKYYDDEGNLVGVEKELRDYVRAIARDNNMYQAGEGAMIATDILGAKGAFTFLKNYREPILRSLATLGAGVVGMGAGKIPGVKVPKIKGSSTGKFADLSPSVQKKLEGTFLENLSKDHNFITSANRTDPSRKAVTVGKQDTVMFHKKATQEQILEDFPIGPNHGKFLENPRQQITNPNNLKNLERIVPPKAEEEIFLYMQKLIKEGYRFKELAKMDKIFPKGFKGIEANGALPGKKKYLAWAKANKADLFPEHNTYNRLEYDLSLIHI